MRRHPQTTVGPKLSLASKAVRGLHPGNQLRGPYRTDAGNLPQQLGGQMFPALGQELAAYLPPQNLQSIQMLIEQLRTPAHPSL